MGQGQARYRSLVVPAAGQALARRAGALGCAVPAPLRAAACRGGSRTHRPDAPFSRQPARLPDNGGRGRPAARHPATPLHPLLRLSRPWIPASGCLLPRPLGRRLPPHLVVLSAVERPTARRRERHCPRWRRPVAARGAPSTPRPWRPAAAVVGVAAVRVRAPPTVFSPGTSPSACCGGGLPSVAAEATSSTGPGTCPLRSPNAHGAVAAARVLVTGGWRGGGRPRTGHTGGDVGGCRSPSRGGGRPCVARRLWGTQTRHSGWSAPGVCRAAAAAGARAAGRRMARGPPAETSRGPPTTGARTNQTPRLGRQRATAAAAARRAGPSRGSAGLPPPNPPPPSPGPGDHASFGVQSGDRIRRRRRRLRWEGGSLSARGRRPSTHAGRPCPPGPGDRGGKQGSPPPPRPP